VIKLALIILLSGCVSKHQRFYKNFEPTESPCVDGTVLNISKSTCNAVYWGVTDNIIKFRCTDAYSGNWWNAMAFYVLPSDYGKEINPNWTIFCADRRFVVFTEEFSSQIDTP
jgi:hypothetical protein